MPITNIDMPSLVKLLPHGEVYLLVFDLEVGPQTTRIFT